MSATSHLRFPLSNNGLTSASRRPQALQVNFAKPATVIAPRAVPHQHGSPNATFH